MVSLLDTHVWMQQNLEVGHSDCQRVLSSWGDGSASEVQASEARGHEFDPQKWQCTLVMLVLRSQRQEGPQGSGAHQSV